MLFYEYSLQSIMHLPTEKDCWSSEVWIFSYLKHSLKPSLLSVNIFGFAFQDCRWKRLVFIFDMFFFPFELSETIHPVDQGKMQLELDQLVLLGVRPWIFPHCAVLIRPYISSPLVLVNLRLETSKPFRSAWPMNWLMLQRVHPTGNEDNFFGSFTRVALIFFFSLVLFYLFSLLQGFPILCFFFCNFSYAIKKKDEIERVAKANRWGARKKYGSIGRHFCLFSLFSPGIYLVLWIWLSNGW